jgi:hypothetical protein
MLLGAGAEVSLQEEPFAEATNIGAEATMLVRTRVRRSERVIIFWIDAEFPASLSISLSLLFWIHNLIYFVSALLQPVPAGFRHLLPL